MAKLDRKVPMRTLKSKEKNWDTRPSLYFNDIELPAIKNWQVGEEYDISLKVKMNGSSIREDKKGKSTISADFVITGIYNK